MGGGDGVAKGQGKGPGVYTQSFVVVVFGCVSTLLLPTPLTMLHQTAAVLISTISPPQHLFLQLFTNQISAFYQISQKFHTHSSCGVVESAWRQSTALPPRQYSTIAIVAFRGTMVSSGPKFRRPRKPIEARVAPKTSKTPMSLKRMRGGCDPPQSTVKRRRGSKCTRSRGKLQ